LAPEVINYGGMVALSVRVYATSDSNRLPNGTATAASRGMLLSELAAGQHSVFPGLVEVYDKIVRPAGGEEAGSAGGMSCR
jgi:hypothetical protein